VEILCINKRYNKYDGMKRALRVLVEFASDFVLFVDSWG